MSSTHAAMTSLRSFLELSPRKLVQLILLAGLLATLCCPSVEAAKRRSKKTKRQGKGRRKWQEGDIRFTRGQSRSEGTVLLYHKGSWGAICDDMWNDAAADVACRQRGFPGSARAPLKMEFGGRGKRKMWITRVQCRGDESKLLDCDYVGWGRRVRHMCQGQWRAVGVVCHPKPHKKHRLTRRKRGRKWHSRRATRARARAAGKRRRARTRATTVKPTTKSPVTTTADLAAKATELHHNVLSVWEDEAAVDTNSLSHARNSPREALRPFAIYESLEALELDAAPRRQGSRRGQKETAVREAIVTPIPHSTTAAMPTTTPMIATPSPQTTTTEKTTTSTTTTPQTSTTTETTTRTTTTPQTTTTAQTITTEATTSTSDPTTTPKTTTEETTPTTTALPTTPTTTTTTTTTHPTTTTTTHSTSTTTTTTTEPTTTTTTTTSTLPTTTTPLTLSTTSTTTTAVPTTTATVSTTTVTPTITSTSSPSDSWTIGDKDDKPEKPSVSGGAVDLAKVKASEELTLKDGHLQSQDALLLQADSPARPELELRLVGGRYPWEGRLEVRVMTEVPGPWGTVCGEHWGLRETMVVCRQLGHNYAKQALQIAYFGGLSQPKTFYSFDCTGRESSLSNCQAIPTSHNHTCPKPTLVASLSCATYLPDLIPDTKRLEDSVRLQDRPLYYLQCALEENCLSSSAYEIRNNSKNWRSNMRRLLRFSTIVHNRGDADFRPNVAKAQWQWHTCHMHYHSMEVFAHYDILSDNGTRLAEGSKASFCLEDTMCDKGVSRQFQCDNFGDQGLSVNCSDNYLWDIDCQWIDVTDIEPGIYAFLLEVNPSMYVAEMNYDNNVARCTLWYSGYEAKLLDCHHESLLDYRL